EASPQPNVSARARAMESRRVGEVYRWFGPGVPRWCVASVAGSARGGGFGTREPQAGAAVRLLRFLGCLQPYQRPLLGAVLAGMHQDRRLGLRQVAHAGLIDRVLLFADDPRGPLRLLVHGALEGNRRVGQAVVVVAAKHAVLVDRELEDV